MLETDETTRNARAALDDIRMLEGTIRTRLIYERKGGPGED